MFPQTSYEEQPATLQIIQAYNHTQRSVLFQLAREAAAEIAHANRSEKIAFWEQFKAEERTCMDQAFPPLVRTPILDAVNGILQNLRTPMPFFNLAPLAFANPVPVVSDDEDETPTP